MLPTFKKNLFICIFKYKSYAHVYIYMYQRSNKDKKKVLAFATVKSD